MKNRHLSNSDFSYAKFHHIGVACKDIRSTLDELLIFLPHKFNCTDIIYDKKLNASLQLISLGSQAHLELVSGQIVKNILKKDQKLYHICFEVSDIKNYSLLLRDKGYLPITDLIPADLFDGRLVQFFKTPMGLTEILEENDVT